MEEKYTLTGEGSAYLYENLSFKDMEGSFGGDYSKRILYSLFCMHQVVLMKLFKQLGQIIQMQIVLRKLKKISFH